MGEYKDNLHAALSENARLAEELRSKARVLEQLFAQRKDALQRSYQALERKPVTPVSDRHEACKRPHPPALIVVEDNSDDFMLLKRALNKAGATARVWRARDAAETISVLAQLETSEGKICLVMDICLPGLNGFDLLSKIREKQPRDRFKCAVLTGMTDQATQARAYSAGVEAYFLKPASPEEWVSLARSIQRFAAA